jgi:hypothetical protein
MLESVVLQILGTSDVQVDGQPGREQIRGFDLHEMQELAQDLKNELLGNLNRVDFPLIRQAHQYVQHIKGSPTFVVLLTDQTAWFQAQPIAGSGWEEIITSDGHWWEEVLLAWAEEQGIRCHCVRFEVPPEVKSGVADWEGMAKRATQFLGQLIQNNRIHLPDQQVFSFETLFIQHSSGTPALSSALYLWGIEQRLEGQAVEFLYLSRQDEEPRQHSGSHWQWRLKAPQIRQLLAVQDFAGILRLAKGDVDKDMEKQIRRLDRAVSFNLRELNLGLNPEEEVLERIAIACWSERAFRERGQWMHWILRVAGAFELVLKCLVVQQGQGQFSWRRRNNGSVDLFHQQDPVFANITAIARGISQGNFLGRKDNQDFTYRFDPIARSQELSYFQSFYCDDPGWILNKNKQIKFAEIRNDLYHSLQGDVIDQALDQKTLELGSVTRADHPAQVAVGHLEFLIGLAGIQSKIQERVRDYQTQVQRIEEQL